MYLLVANSNAPGQWDYVGCQRCESRYVWLGFTINSFNCAHWILIVNVHEQRTMLVVRATNHGGSVLGFMFRSRSYDVELMGYILTNSLADLQAAYIINGNCKNVMNMSQSDQLELWRSIMDGMHLNCRVYNTVASFISQVTYFCEFNTSKVKCILLV